ncbi:MAG: protein-glutamate O-methyltransferase CheR [Candidatus Goldbacteria bacterium]|nr:protein-glutamate O-methyltransferase CheR [Candidatus Goldiibacteriota bacterium]
MDENKAFEKIKESIYNKFSLDLNQYKENYLKRRLDARMRSLQIISYEEYLKYLLTKEEEYDNLLDKLTINVTQFFRDPDTFEEIKKNILPNLMRNNNTIKVWSAGCSTGEEAYSIAIMMEEISETLGILNYNYNIVGTDINEKSLYKARLGYYEGRTLDNLSDIRKKKDFNFDGKNYIIKENIKKKVEFLKYNIMEPFKRGYFNIIFCRNVIIYFTRELQNKVIGYFYDSLKENGIFIMGKTETMLMNFRDKFECLNIKERIFIKRV